MKISAIDCGSSIDGINRYCSLLQNYTDYANKYGVNPEQQEIIFTPSTGYQELSKTEKVDHYIKLVLLQIESVITIVPEIRRWQEILQPDQTELEHWEETTREVLTMGNAKLTPKVLNIFNTDGGLAFQQIKPLGIELIALAEQLSAQVTIHQALNDLGNSFNISEEDLNNIIDYIIIETIRPTEDLTPIPEEQTDALEQVRQIFNKTLSVSRTRKGVFGITVL